MSLLLLLLLLPVASLQEPPGAILLRGGRWVDAGGAVREGARFRIEGGLIRKIGAEAGTPADAKLVEFPSGSWVLPGFVDAHSHLGSAFDVEETTSAVDFDLRAVDAFAARHPDVLRAVSSGVTRVGVAPGNGNVVGGWIGTIRLNGASYDRSIHRSEAVLKGSLGPEVLRRDRRPTSLLGALDLLGKAIAEASPRKQAFLIHVPGRAELEALLRLPLPAEARIGLLSLGEAGRCADLLQGDRMPVALGPLLPTDRRETLEAAGRLERAGVPVAFVSDAPRGATEGLRFSAALAVRHGLSPAAARRALTSVPARLLGLEGSLGAIHEGRPADLVVWSGDPLDLTSRVDLVLVDGVEVYRRKGGP